MLFYDNSDQKGHEKALKAQELFIACVRKLRANFEPVDVVDILRSPDNRVEHTEMEEGQVVKGKQVSQIHQLLPPTLQSWFLLCTSKKSSLNWTVN